MKITFRRSSLILAFASIALVPAAFSGSRVKNGGSGYLCPGMKPMVVEYALARLHQPIERLQEIDDREQFIQYVLAHVENPTFARVLREQWDTYGDSSTWPEGSMDGIEVLFQRSNEVIARYGSDARIPAEDPTAEICAFPLYEPEMCCDRLLFSYFDAESPTPSRIEANFSQISRYQRNILELHEAMYRVGRSLALLPPPPFHMDVRSQVESYRKIDITGELPVHAVIGMTIRLLDPKDRGFNELLYWHWSREFYGPQMTKSSLATR